MDKVLSFIGLAKKAGKLISGTEIVLDAVRHGKSKLVVIATDISEKQEKAIVKTLTHYNVKYVKYATKSELGKALGYEERAVVSISDESFKNGILDKMA
ncbi:MAG: ribosomal L7Ae/L30e/S12e/Gadd45 family protein [Clostridia bacterium]|nr:ribosomal L7Ae/L30e/S12e/Gadd45 family protein [Clostridia bacterium]